MSTMVLHAKGSASINRTADRYDRVRVLRANRVVFRPRFADPLASPRALVYAAMLSAGIWVALIGLIVAL